MSLKLEGGQGYIILSRNNSRQHERLQKWLQSLRHLVCEQSGLYVHLYKGFYETSIGHKIENEQFRKPFEVPYKLYAL